MSVVHHVIYVTLCFQELVFVQLIQEIKSIRVCGLVIACFRFTREVTAQEVVTGKVRVGGGRGRGLVRDRGNGGRASGGRDARVKGQVRHDLGDVHLLVVV